MDRFHSRSRPARGVIASSDQPTIVFLTVCTKNRYPWLAQPEPHRVLVEVWRSLSDWKVSRYVLMPDHLHFFAWPGSYGISFDRWVTAWKAKASRTLANKAFRWQSGAFHHRIRSWESAEAKYLYMLNNPVSWTGPKNGPTKGNYSKSKNGGRPLVSGSASLALPLPCARDPRSYE